MAEGDVLSSFEDVLASCDETNPWQQRSDGSSQYVADHQLLEELLGIPLGEGRDTQSGRFAKAVDAWVAHELRRCGFPPDEVWPRLHTPRVLPRELGLFINRLPEYLRELVSEQLQRNKTVAPTDAYVLGRAYVKQVDVLVAQWARGPELMVSTKGMSSSFRKNLANRFEEAYGDAKNLKARYPLAAMGFLFVLRSTVLEEPGAFERAVDMMRKLSDEPDVYDATSIVLAEWSDDPFDGVRLLHDDIPADLRTEVFIDALVGRVLERTPVDMHVAVRERLEHRGLPLPEED